MFRAHVLIVRRAKLYYTVSGIIWYHHTYRCDDTRDCIIGVMISSGQRLYNRCDDTRDCIIQFCPPDDEHMCSKHVEAWNKLIIKFSASSWLILINKFMCSRTMWTSSQICRWPCTAKHWMSYWSLYVTPYVPQSLYYRHQLCKVGKSN